MQIAGGGVRIDGERVTDKGVSVPVGATVVAQVGKRKVRLRHNYLKIILQKVLTDDFCSVECEPPKRSENRRKRIKSANRLIFNNLQPIGVKCSGTGINPEGF